LEQSQERAREGKEDVFNFLILRDHLLCRYLCIAGLYPKCPIHFVWQTSTQGS